MEGNGGGVEEGKRVNDKVMTTVLTVTSSRKRLSWYGWDEVLREEAVVVWVG